MMMSEYIGSYKNYLLFKGVIGVFREFPSTTAEVAKKRGLKVEAVQRVSRVLVEHRIIKRCRYDISTGGKQAVYELIKDEDLHRPLVQQQQQPVNPKNGDKYYDKEGQWFQFRFGSWIKIRVRDANW